MASLLPFSLPQPLGVGPLPTPPLTNAIMRCYWFDGSAPDSVWYSDRTGNVLGDNANWTARLKFYDSAINPAINPPYPSHIIRAFSAGAIKDSLTSFQGILISFGNTRATSPLAWVPGNVTPITINSDIPISCQYWQQSQGAWRYNNAWWIIAQIQSGSDFGIRVYKNTGDPNTGLGWIAQDTGNQPVALVANTDPFVPNSIPNFKPFWDGTSNKIYIAYISNSFTGFGLTKNFTTITLKDFDMNTGLWGSSHDSFTVTATNNPPATDGSLDTGEELSVTIDGICQTDQGITQVAFTVTDATGSRSSFSGTKIIKYRALLSGSWTETTVFSGVFNTAGTTGTFDQMLMDPDGVNVNFTYSTNGAVLPESVIAYDQKINSITGVLGLKYTFPFAGESQIDCFGRGIIFNGYPCYGFDYQQLTQKPIAVWMGGPGFTFTLEQPLGTSPPEVDSTCVNLTYVSSNISQNAVSFAGHQGLPVGFAPATADSLGK